MTENEITQKAWDYALISVKGDVVPEANIHLLAANIQVILDIEAAKVSPRLQVYPFFQEIVNEMKARPEADPVGILEETVGPLLDACNKLNLWIADHQTWDFRNEPPWYEEFIGELTRFDVDLSPIWWGSPQDEDIDYDLEFEHYVDWS